MEENNDIPYCPIREGLKFLGGKWALLILWELREPRRFGEIKKEIPDISEKMLIQTLKMLQSGGFINRNDFETIPPKVVYSITSKGTRALEIIPIFADVVED